jgi:AraC-like DNA-binding protein
MPSVPVARALMVAPWVDHVRDLGAPAEALLVRAGIRPELLCHPLAAVSLRQALRWIELASRCLGTEHLGLEVGCATSNEAMGGYGSMLARARTLHEYLHRGIALYGTVVVGQTFWMSAHGAHVRLNLGSSWKPGLGDYQSHLNSFAITIANIRRFAGPGWSPSEISFGFRPREAIPATDVFGGARIVHRPGQTYLEFPRSLLGLRPHHSARAAGPGEAPIPERLPEDLAGLVGLEIEALLPEGGVPVDLVAEALGLSRRSLQRGLAAQGVSYSDLLGAVRLRRAAHWLENTEKPIGEIALDLGYTDASNFTRAFRRQTGVSPKTFRDTAGRC